MNHAFIHKIIPCIACIIVACNNTFSQTDTSSANTYDALSLKDLLNVKVVSVSKKAELLFDAPLSASVVSKDEIRKAGCTSIMEALRLVPGVIAREQSNGNYDIHLRGMDNVPPNASFDIASTTTLVMIDSRPIYSYLRGGTFWETLPIDLNDVEKIEIIRGPAAALYGPNAVNGVINIITRQAKHDGLNIVANSTQGSNHTFINNASLGYQSKKWSMMASANYQGRERTQTSYFEFTRNKWLDAPPYFINFGGDTMRNVSDRYPNPALAMEKYAGNVFLSYDPATRIKLSLSAGIQHSIVQKVSAENQITPLSTASSDSRYIDLRANIRSLTAQVSYNKGTQVADFDPGNKYDFSTFDANIEYNYVKGNFSVKPGLSYRNAVYDDTPYSDTANKAGIFNAKGQITTRSATLRGEYRLLAGKLRLIAGFATNTFNYPDTTYLSYQFAATWKPDKRNLFRVVYSRAPRSSAIFDTYVDQVVAFFPSGYKKYTQLALAGNKNIKLLTADLFEIGYRASLARELEIDVELFDIRAKNYNLLVRNRSYTQVIGTDTIEYSLVNSMNIPLKLRQVGITVALTYTSKKLQVKPFVTLQHSSGKDYTPYSNTPDAGGPNNIYSGIGTTTTLESTPAVYGGITVNYAIASKFNINLSGYYYSKQTYYHLSNVLFNFDGRGVDHIKAKMIVNAKLTYEAAKGLLLFCSGKNLLNDTSREFFRADDVPLALQAGLNFEL